MCRHYEYFLVEDPIQTSHEKDLGVVIINKFEVRERCGKASKKANAMIGMINSAIK